MSKAQLRTRTSHVIQPSPLTLAPDLGRDSEWRLGRAGKRARGGWGEWASGRQRRLREHEHVVAIHSTVVAEWG